MKPESHKFVSNSAENPHAVKIWCEYCGLIIFDGNRENVDLSWLAGPCPFTPHEADEVIENSKRSKYPPATMLFTAASSANKT